MDSVDHTMVDAINQIGHVMSLSTIAESTESEAVLQQLRSQGADYAQGFGLHKPEPLSIYLEAMTNAPL